MNDMEMQKIIDLYSLIPDNNLENIILTEYNRIQKREIKGKSKKDKIKKIFGNSNMKNIFLSKIKDIYHINKADYEEIEKILTLDDFRIGLGILNRCFSDKEFNRLHFREFLNSEQFLILTGKRNNVDINVPSTMVCNKMSIECQKQKMEEEFNNIEGDKMLDKYICEIKTENNYYNIYPKYKIEKEFIKKVPDEQFLERGNIVINPSYSFEKETQYHNNVWIIGLKDEDLIDNKNQDGEWLLTHTKIKDKVLMEEERIYDLQRENIHEIVRPLNSNVDIHEYNFEKLEITSPKLSNNYPICLKILDKLYGPFEVFTSGYTCYVSFEKNDYIIKSYNITKLDNSIIDLQLRDRTFVEVACLNYACNFGEYIDYLSDDKLIARFEEYIKNPVNFKREIKLENVRDLIKGLQGTNLIAQGMTIIDDIKPIIEKRVDRVERILSDFVENEIRIDDIAAIMAELMITKESDRFDTFVEKILDKEVFTRKVQNIGLVKEKLEKIKIEIEIEDKRLEKMREEISGSNKKQISVKIKESTDNELDNFGEEIKEKQKKLSDLHKKYDEYHVKYETIYDLDVHIGTQKNEKERLENEIEKLKKENNDLKKESTDVETSLDSKIEDFYKRIPEMTFNGMVSSKMLKVASEWNDEKEEEYYQQIVNHMKSITCDKLEKDDLIEYLYGSISQKRRAYGKNDIINFMICITQGFLTVFSGAPGVGKTSICNIIANTLGLNSIEDKGLSKDVVLANRFIDISVERGWTSKYDLVGYYNPLTKTFDKHNSRLYSAFNILDVEGKDSSVPFLVLLDEANLSPMEYYWSDFIKLCEYDLDDCKRVITLGENFNYYIPKTLRFIATINNDHTTEPLSPRLIDRAWIITLPEKFEYNEEFEEISEHLISWNCLENVFETENESSSEFNEFSKELDEIYEMFQNENIGIPISARIKKNIRRYLLAGNNLFEPEKERTNPKFIALDYVVAQKLLPKIEGRNDIEENYKKFLEKLQKYCGAKNMTVSSEIITRILRKGKNNMGYYNFFD